MVESVFDARRKVVFNNFIFSVLLIIKNFRSQVAQVKVPKSWF